MKHLHAFRMALVLLAVFLFAVSVQARGHIQGVAQIVANVSTAGLSSTFKFPRVLTGATITVYCPQNTATICTIFSDSAGLAKSNPFTASSSDGSYSFYTDAPAVSIRISGVTGVSAFTISDVPVVSGTNVSSLVCGGSNDTTLLSNANTAGGTIVIPKGVTCASNSQSISATVRIENGGLLRPVTGQTITLTGPLEIGVYAAFTNATAGLGTVSFAGNKVLTEVWTEWWGAGAGVAAATNSIAFQATSDALITNNASNYGNGCILFGPGVYSFSSPWVIGATSLGAFTGISLKGTNGLVGTFLQWTGSTSAIAIKFMSGRSNRIDNLLLESSVAHGSTIGIWLTGPAGSNGTQITGLHFDTVTIRNFYYGMKIGGDGTVAASEVYLFNCTLSQNDIGLFSTGSGNTLNIDSIDSSYSSNLQWGIQAGAGSGAIHVHGGGLQANGRNGVLTTGDISLSLGWNGTTHIENVRFEPGGGYQITGITNANPAVVTTSAAHGITNGDTVYFAGAQSTLGTALNGIPLVATVLNATTFSVPVNTLASSVYGGSGAGVDRAANGGGGIVNQGNIASVLVNNCQWNAPNGPAYAQFRGAAFWTFDSLSLGTDAQDGWLLWDTANSGATGLIVRNSQIQNTNTRVMPGGNNNSTTLGLQMAPDTGGSWGLSIISENNYYVNTGVATRFDTMTAIVGFTPSSLTKIFANRRIDSFGRVTSDIFDISNQDATPSVKWANRFKEADGAPTNQTNLINGVDGQTVTIFFTTANRTVVNNANQKLAGAVNFVGTASDILTLLNVGGVWYEVSRSVN